MNDVYEIINEIAQCETQNIEITYVQDIKCRRWTWCDLENNKIWHIRLSSVRALSRYPSYNYIVNFVKNKSTALETKKILDKLDFLKAFI